MNTTFRNHSKTAGHFSLPVLVVAAIGAMGIGAIGRPLNAHPAPIVIAVAAPVAAGGFIDHAVLNDASLLPAPNPAPLAVAAYDD